MATAGYWRCCNCGFRAKTMSQPVPNNTFLYCLFSSEMKDSIKILLLLFALSLARGRPVPEEGDWGEKEKWEEEEWDDDDEDWDEEEWDDDEEDWEEKERDDNEEEGDEKEWDDDDEEGDDDGKADGYKEDDEGDWNDDEDGYDEGTEETPGSGQNDEAENGENENGENELNNEPLQDENENEDENKAVPANSYDDQGSYSPYYLPQFYLYS